MTNDTFLNKFLLIIGLLILFVIPELNNVHYDPQPQFWAEITVVWGILALFLWCLVFSPSLSIPSIVIPLFLFGGYLLLQPSLVSVDFPGLSAITALEMLTGILLAIAISTLKENFGLKRIVVLVCSILLIGALLQTMIGFIQYIGAARHFGSLIFYDSDHPTTNIFGHFGQRNHYAHYLSWGTFGLIYLYQQRKVPQWLFYTLLVWLCFSLTIAASRSVFMYFILAFLIGIINVAVQKTADSKNLLKLIVIAVVALFAIEYFYPLLHKLFTPHNNFSSGLGRLDSDSGTGRRGIEWAKAWLVFKSHPLFGDGWNEYAKQSVLLHHLFPNAAPNSGLFTNCHNLILQLLAETGIIGTLIVIGGIVAAIWRTLKNSFSTGTIIGLCMVATTLAHSMDEYPLWYMYFLAGLITFLSLDKPLLTISATWAAGIFAAPLAIIAYLVISGSIIFDNLVDYYDAPDDQPTFNQQAKYLENLVDNNYLWSYHAIYTLDNYINVDDSMTNALFTPAVQLRYTHRFDTFHPYPDTMMKEAMLDWNLGFKESAVALVKTDVQAFPVYVPSFRTTLKDKKYQPLVELLAPPVITKKN